MGFDHRRIWQRDSCEPWTLIPPWKKKITLPWTCENGIGDFVEVLELKLRVEDRISCHIKVLLPEGTEQTSTLHRNWTGTERGIECTRAEASGTAPWQPCRSPCSGMTWLAVSDQVKDHHQPGSVELYLALWRSSSKMPERSPNEKADHPNHFWSGLPHSVAGLLTSRPRFFSTAFVSQHM